MKINSLNAEPETDCYMWVADARQQYHSVVVHSSSVHSSYAS